MPRYQPKPLQTIQLMPADPSELTDAVNAPAPSPDPTPIVTTTDV